jgi:hypothetical protein
MVMLSAMLAASVPVDPISCVVTLGRGLAADSGWGLVTLSVKFAFVVPAQPSCNVRNPLYLSFTLKWAQILRFGNPVRSGLAAFTRQN